MFVQFETAYMKSMNIPGISTYDRLSFLLSNKLVIGLEEKNLGVSNLLQIFVI